MVPFAYVVPAAARDNCVIIYINLVLPMGWMDLPKYFCTISKTLTYGANSLVHKSLLVLTYGAISAIPETSPGPHYTLYSITHIY